MATAPARSVNEPTLSDAAQRSRRRNGTPEDYPHEIADGVRLGRGALVDFDARVGVPVPTGGRGQRLAIGESAVIRGGTTIYMGCEIGRDVDLGFNVVIHEQTVIGDSVRVGENTVIGRGCMIGNRVTIDENCVIAPQTTIEDDVHIAPGVVTANDPHPGSATTLCARGPLVSRGAQIGTNATLLPFVVVGRYAIVGAGSVVTRDVRAGTVVVGNPARILKSTSDVKCPLDLQEGTYLRPAGRAAM